jgi:hypothetical protein
MNSFNNQIIEVVPKREHVFLSRDFVWHVLTPWGTPNVNPKQKIVEKQGIGARSLAHNTLEG